MLNLLFILIKFIIDIYLLSLYNSYRRYKGERNYNGYFICKKTILLSPYKCLSLFKQINLIHIKAQELDSYSCAYYLFLKIK